MSDISKISFREFLRNPKVVFPIPGDGILVERRDGDSFWIYPKKMSDIMSDVIPKEVAPVSAVKKTSHGWCEGHFEKGVEYDRELVTVEDANGTELITKKLLCPACIGKLEAQVKNYGGRVFRHTI